MKELIFWQKNFSAHQTALIRKLAENSTRKVSLVINEETSKEIREFEWGVLNYGNTNIINYGDKKKIYELHDKVGADYIHIMSGTRTNSITRSHLNILIKKGAQIGIYSEARDWRGLRGLIKILQDKIDYRLNLTRIAFVLAVGNLGIKWFRSCGFADTKIYHYGYFIEDPSRIIQSQNKNKDAIEIIFVGELTYRKGVDLLIKALEQLKGKNWELVIIGDGDRRQELQKLVISIGLESKIHFMGARSNPDALNSINNSNLLVLPSRWDGWGAVVNEALMCGVPVICSDKCGAADLIRNGERGHIFKSQSIDDLTSKISMFTENINSYDSVFIRKWAECIMGETAAAYTDAILNNVFGNSIRPQTPWVIP